MSGIQHTKQRYSHPPSTHVLHGSRPSTYHKYTVVRHVRNHVSWEHKEPHGSELDTDSIVNCTVGIYCVWRQAAVQEFKFQWKVKSKIKHCVSSLFLSPCSSQGLFHQGPVRRLSPVSQGVTEDNDSF